MAEPSTSCSKLSPPDQVWKAKKLTYDEKKANLKAKLEAIVAAAGEDGSESD